MRFLAYRRSRQQLPTIRHRNRNDQDARSLQPPVDSRGSVSDLRATIEAFATRCAARRVAQGADKRPLLEAFARLERTAANNDVAGEIFADRELHLTVVRMADVQALQEVWEVAAHGMK